MINPSTAGEVQKYVTFSISKMTGRRQRLFVSKTTTDRRTPFYKWPIGLSSSMPIATTRSCGRPVPTVRNLESCSSPMKPKRPKGSSKKSTRDSKKILLRNPKTSRFSFERTNNRAPLRWSCDVAKYPMLSRAANRSSIAKKYAISLPTSNGSTHLTMSSHCCV